MASDHGTKFMHVRFHNSILKVASLAGESDGCIADLALHFWLNSS